MKITISILIVIAVVVGGFFLFFGGEDGANTEEDKEINEEVSAFVFPEVYSEISWGESVDTIKDAVGYTDGKGNFKVVSFKGTERSALIETNELEDFPRMLLSLTEYYGNALGEGWSDNEIDIDGLGISPLTGDGPYTSVSGYIKSAEGLISTLQINAELTGTESDSDGPIQFECPCSINVSVFEGVPTPVTSLLEQI